MLSSCPFLGGGGWPGGDIAIRADYIQLLFILLLRPGAQGLVIILVFIFRTFFIFTSKCKKAAQTFKRMYSKEQEKEVGALGRENYLSL